MRRLGRLLAFVLVSGLFVLLAIWLLNNFNPRSVWFAFLWNWLAISYLAVLGQFLPVVFPDSYYALSRFESDGAVYSALGIRLFQKVVRLAPLALFSPGLRFNSRRDLLNRLEMEMRRVEAAHALAFWLVTISALLFWWRGLAPAAAWMMVFNLPLNVYPVMLQRYNRGRWVRLAPKLGKLDDL